MKTGARSATVPLKASTHRQHPKPSTQPINIDINKLQGLGLAHFDDVLRDDTHLASRP